MNVTIVTDRWDENGGGREQYLAELAAFLVRHGRAVDVFCHRVSGRPPDVTNLRVFDGLRVLAEVALNRAVACRHAENPGRPILAAQPVIGATHYQLHSGLVMESLAAERESFGGGLRQALFWPATWATPRRRRLLRRESRMLLASRGPRLMVFSARLADTLIRSFGVSPERVRVARQGVDLDRFHPPPDLSLASGPLRLLFVARNSLLKGFRATVAAFGEVAANGIAVQLTVAGGHADRRFGPMARHSGPGDAVRFVGRLGRDDLANLYRQSHILVHPSFHDPFPRVVLEALACGCAVVATRRCGTSELMTDGLEGALTDDPADVRSIVVAIRSLAAPDRLLEARRAAWGLAAHYPFDAHAEQVEDWLTEGLG
jgi:D-inositol-3-phosphate glycosyltransferase